MCVLPIHHVNGTVVTLITPFYCKGGLVLNRKFKSAGFWRRLHGRASDLRECRADVLEFLLDANEDMIAYRLDELRWIDMWRRSAC